MSYIPAHAPHHEWARATGPRHEWRVSCDSNGRFCGLKLKARKVGVRDNKPRKRV